MEKRALERRLRKIGAIGDNDILADFDSAGRTSELPSGALLIQLSELPHTPFAMGIMCHEIFHAVTFLMRRVGITLCDESDEAYAYAISDLTEQMVTALAMGTKKKRR